MDFNALGPVALPPGPGAGLAAGLKAEFAAVESLLQAVTAALETGDHQGALALLAARPAAAQILRDSPQLIPIRSELDAILPRQAPAEAIFRAAVQAIRDGDGAEAVRLIASRPEIARAVETILSRAAGAADGTLRLQTLEFVLRTVTTALESGDHQGAVRLIASHPEIARALTEEPALTAARPEVQADRVAPGIESRAAPEIRQLLELVDRTISPPAAVVLPHAADQARERAETSLAAAARALQAGDAPIPETPANPQTAYSLANQLFDSGQYLNYLRAAELGRLIVSWHVPKKTHTREKRPGLIARSWRRAPMLVLLAGWLMIGIFGAVIVRMSDAQADSAFEVWALGFLALVGFQFYVTIRNARF